MNELIIFSKILLVWARCMRTKVRLWFVFGFAFSIYFSNGNVMCNWFCGNWISSHFVRRRKLSREISCVWEYSKYRAHLCAQRSTCRLGLEFYQIQIQIQKYNSRWEENKLCKIAYIKQSGTLVHAFRMQPCVCPNWVQLPLVWCSGKHCWVSGKTIFTQDNSSWVSDVVIEIRCLAQK